MIYGGKNMKVFNIYSTIYPKWINEELEKIGNSDFFEFTYKQGKGHFKISIEILITGFNQTEFKKVATIIESSENPKVIAGFLNNVIIKLYDRFNLELQGNDPDRDKILGWLTKRNDILVKKFDVSPVGSKQETEVITDVEVVETVESNDNITPLKKCNVIRFIPSQVKPIWENGTIKSFIGYHFEYRGMSLQAYRSDGWENGLKKDAQIFIIDPVIGLPITSYHGLLAELEDKLSEVFINYLKTLESNKETIVQIAMAFKSLKEAA